MREKIAEVIHNGFYQLLCDPKIREERMNGIVNRILALFPANESGLVRVKECPNGENVFKFSGQREKHTTSTGMWECNVCHGAGTIRERVSMEEAAKIYKDLLTPGSDTTVFMVDGKRYIKLADGSRIVKEGE